jgi:hypothetical protein
MDYYSAARWFSFSLSRFTLNENLVLVRFRLQVRGASPVLAYE